MSAVLVLVCSAALGIEVGWRPLPDGGLEYLVQIEPELLETLREGQVLQSDVPPQLRDIRRWRISVGRGRLPRQEIAPAAAEAPPDLTDPRQRVLPMESDSRFATAPENWSPLPARTGPPAATTAPPATGRSQPNTAPRYRITEPAGAERAEPAEAEAAPAEDRANSPPPAIDAGDLGPRYSGQNRYAVPAPPRPDDGTLPPLEDRYGVRNLDQSVPAIPEEHRREAGTAGDAQAPPLVTVPRREADEDPFARRSSAPPPATADDLTGDEPIEHTATAAPRSRYPLRNEAAVSPPGADRSATLGNGPFGSGAPGSGAPGSGTVGSGTTGATSRGTSLPAPSNSPSDFNPPDDEPSVESSGWGTLTLVLVLLFASLGGNFWLGWAIWETQARYRQLMLEKLGPMPR